MKKNVCFFILLLIATCIFGQTGKENESGWVGIWKISYFSINDQIWREKKIELNADGAVNEWQDDKGFNENGYWRIENYPLNNSNLKIKVLHFNAGLEEFLIFFNLPKKRHYGICTIAEMGFIWPTNIYEFEFIKIGNL